MSTNSMTAIVLFFSMSIAFATGEASSTGDMLIENIRIIDGKGNAPVEAQDVLVAMEKLPKWRTTESSRRQRK